MPRGPRLAVGLLPGALVIAGTCACQRRREPPPPPPPAVEPGPAAAVDPGPRPAGGPPAPAAGLDRRDVTAVVGAARRAAIGDLDGDGRPEWVLVDADHLRVVRPSGEELARAPVPAGIQVLVVADLDGDGRAEIYAGWGRTAERKDGAARVTRHRLDGGGLAAEDLLVPRTTRAEIAAIVPTAAGGAPGGAAELLVAWYDDKYEVQAARLGPGPGWPRDDVARIRMAAAWAIGDLDGDGAPDLAVGRIYGDDRTEDGGAFLLRPDGARVSIPTTRGVRALAFADADGDGRAELYVADGWHHRYGELARGLVTRVTWEGGAPRAATIDDPPGQFVVWRIVPADVDGDGRPELVALGSHSVRVLRHDGGRWRALTVAGEARDVAAGDLDGVPGAELLIVGDTSEVITLRGAAWP